MTSCGLGTWSIRKCWVECIVLPQNWWVAIDIASMSCSLTVAKVFWSIWNVSFLFWIKKNGGTVMEVFLGRVQAERCIARESQWDIVQQKALLGQDVFAGSSLCEWTMHSVKSGCDLCEDDFPKRKRRHEYQFFCCGCLWLFHAKFFCLPVDSSERRNAGPGWIMHQHDVECSHSSSMTAAFSWRNRSLETVREEVTGGVHVFPSSRRFVSLMPQCTCLESAFRRCELRHSVALKTELWRSIEVVLAGNHYVAELSTGFEKSLIYQLLPSAFGDQSGGMLVLLKKFKKKRTERGSSSSGKDRYMRVLVWTFKIWPALFIRRKEPVCAKQNSWFNKWRIDVAFSSHCTSRRNSGVVERNPSVSGTSLLEEIVPLNEPVRMRFFLLATRPKSSRHQINKGWAWF